MRFFPTKLGCILLLLPISGCQAERKITSTAKAEKPTETETQPQKVEPAQLRLMAWNIESGGNDPDVIASQLAEFADRDVIALNEVSPKNFALYGDALGDEFGYVKSSTGGGDRLMILFNQRRFNLLKTENLDELNDGNHRSPLVVFLEDRQSSETFAFVTVHLARGNPKMRESQALGLVEWARKQTVPLFALGDFNFDYSFEQKQGNEAFQAFMRDGVWKWKVPDPLIDTNWSDRDGDGKDNYPDSMLDFAFVANGAREWESKCTVLVRDGDFPDDEATSDHRPIELRVVTNRNG